MPATVIPLTEPHLSAATQMLIRAFAGDPGLLFVLPDAADRARLSERLAEAALRYTLRCGAPLATAGEVHGVALWFPPDGPAPAAADFAETGIAAVPDLLGAAAWARFARLITHLDALHPVFAPEPHWYLAVLGTDPAWQRQGIGTALMEPVFAQADRAGVCCYLEAPTAENARYYANRGFQVVGETDVPDSNVHIWLMRREPV
ncbi:MAG: GNAT family N-acetyltransferase [Thermomicrobiales bacterium]|nr:GNAT family N-acetyltransferase [Thermomicrobiales bacterium]